MSLMSHGFHSLDLQLALLNAFYNLIIFVNSLWRQPLLAVGIPIGEQVLHLFKNLALSEKNTFNHGQLIMNVLDFVYQINLDTDVQQLVQQISQGIIGFFKVSSKLMLEMAE
jgi:hypothetical protein